MWNDARRARPREITYMRAAGSSHTDTETVPRRAPSKLPRRRFDQGKTSNGQGRQAGGGAPKYRQRLYRTEVYAAEYPATAMTECPRGARRPQRAGGVAAPGRCGCALPPHSSARSLSPRALPRGRPLCCSGPQGTGRQVAPARAARLAARAARAAWRRGAARRGAAAAAGARAPRARRRWGRGS